MKGVLEKVSSNPNVPDGRAPLMARVREVLPFERKPLDRQLQAIERHVLERVR